MSTIPVNDPRWKVGAGGDSMEEHFYAFCRDVERDLLPLLRRQGIQNVNLARSQKMSCLFTIRHDNSYGPLKVFVRMREDGILLEVGGYPVDIDSGANPGQVASIIMEEIDSLMKPR